MRIVGRNRTESRPQFAYVCAMLCDGHSRFVAKRCFEHRVDLDRQHDVALDLERMEHLEVTTDGCRLGIKCRDGVICAPVWSDSSGPRSATSARALSASKHDALSPSSLDFERGKVDKRLWKVSAMGRVAVNVGVDPRRT